MAVEVKRLVAETLEVLDDDLTEFHLFPRCLLTNLF